MRMTRGSVAMVVLMAAALRPAVAESLPLFSDLPRAADLAAAPGGQSVACVDAASGVIVVFDPRNPGAKRAAVDVPKAGQPVPVALGFIDDTVLAAVCRAGNEWSLRTWRLRGEAAIEPSNALQALPLGRCDARPEAVHLVVGRSRGWLVVTGLDPPVVRAPIAGRFVGRFTARLCPRLEPGTRPVAATVGPDDELVVCTTASGTDGTTDAVGYFGVDGRRLLGLDTGLRGIRDAVFAADGTAIYVVATASGSAAEPAGLWRLDASLKDGRQAIRPRLIASLADPVAVASPTPRSIIVTQGTPDRTVVQIEPEDEP
jgi:hypothetical protein